MGGTRGLIGTFLEAGINGQEKAAGWETEQEEKKKGRERETQDTK